VGPEVLGAGVPANHSGKKEAVVHGCYHMGSVTLRHNHMDKVRKNRDENLSRHLRVDALGWMQREEPWKTIKCRLNIVATILRTECISLVFFIYGLDVLCELSTGFVNYTVHFVWWCRTD